MDDFPKPDLGHSSKVYEVCLAAMKTITWVNYEPLKEYPTHVDIAVHFCSSIAKSSSYKKFT
jgi:hypothetical protein